METEIKTLEQSLRSILQRFKEEISGIRANRPSPQLVENIAVEYLGQKMQVKQLGSISVVPPREIIITLWDAEAVAPTAKAIEISSLGLTANASGMVIRINLPALTDERRQEYSKLVKATAEQSRIRVRSLRDEYNKKAKALPDEDMKFMSMKKIQGLVDVCNKDIETQVEGKIREINS